MISVNETGFLPSAVKLAISDSPGSFRLIDDTEGKPIDIGVAVIDSGFDETAGCEVYRLDFSGVSAPGIYHLESDDGICSAAFKVEPHVYKTLKNSLLKSFYFQRCGCGLQEEYAGCYKRPRCHINPVRILGSEKTLTVHGGWHDAGDYGRYDSAGAVTVAHMLYAYELFPEAFTDRVNIPESGNGLPDILNECRYELDFLSELQDEDGGVHHKVTTLQFCGFVMPEADLAEQVMFPVTSMSTADFAAVMCIASRVYAGYDPDFARNCIHQAYLAGRWLLQNPENTDFHNPEGCNTGEYTDDSDIDERMWAYAELLRTDTDTMPEERHHINPMSSQSDSRQDSYLANLSAGLELYLKEHDHSDGRSEDDGFGWQDVSCLAAAAVIFDPENHAGEELRNKMSDMLLERANAFVSMQEDGYPVSMKKQDFVWGSNMVVSNRADILILASIALRKKAEKTGEDIRALTLDIELYEEAALNQMHYILGMNAMNISYVTGFGENAFKDPHNRVTIADDIERPIPGMVSGGSCIQLLDEEIKKIADDSTPAQKCYFDHHLSYSTNEIAIYWNSSFLFVTAYFDR